MGMEGRAVAEPVSVAKVTILTALAGIVGPLAAEYSLVLAGAVVGGIVGLSIRTTPLPGLLRPMGHVATGVALALLTTPMASAVASRALPDAWAITAEILLPGVAVATGVFWHRALATWLPGWIGRRAGGTDGGGA
jgi:hypothetical protein